MIVRFSSAPWHLVMVLQKLSYLYCVMAEKRFIELTRILSRDDDLPSKTYTEGNCVSHESFFHFKKEFRLKRRFVIDAGQMHAGSQ